MVIDSQVLTYLICSIASFLGILGSFLMQLIHNRKPKKTFLKLSGNPEKVWKFLKAKRWIISGIVCSILLIVFFVLMIVTQKSL